MRLLLVGNHTCGNRGDAAILRGLLQELRRQEPGAEIDVTSRYPISSSRLLGERVLPDAFHARRLSERSARNPLTGRLAGGTYVLAATSYLRGMHSAARLLPDFLRDGAQGLARYDAVLHVGGSFFVDLYGYSQYDYAVAARMANKPLYWVGHSVGPFDGRMYRMLARAAFRVPQQVVLRERCSGQLMARAGIQPRKTVEGADTAWLVDPSASKPGLPFSDIPDDRPLVAITLRELAPFDRRLGVTQANYERSLGALVSSLVGRGYRVVAVSTCTGIDGYHRDDRMNALRLARHVSVPALYDARLEEPTDEDLGLLFSRCKLVIATRLHSAIIALNYGTPAVALNYEHKSKGVMAQLGMPELSMDLSALFDGSLAQRCDAVLGALPTYRTRVREAVALERERAARSVKGVLDAIRAQREQS